MSFITSLFGKSHNAVTPAVGIRFQTSIYGRPIPLVYGQTKVAGNLIIYGNFTATQVSAGAGGKGALFSSSGSSGTAFDYHVTVAFAVSEGPITAVTAAWKGTALSSIASWGFGFFRGTYPQTAWSFPVTWEVTNDAAVIQSGPVTPLGYNGIAYVNGPNIDLKESTTLPNYQWLVQGLAWRSSGDADASVVVADFLTNTHYGLGLASARLGDFTQYQDYVIAVGLGIAPAYTTQRTASDMIDEIMIATNSACFWSSGKFNITPYGDSTVTANGKTFTPNLTPIYAVGDDDYVRTPQNNVGASASAGSAGPVLLTRKRKSDTINQIKIEYLNSVQNYNPSVVIAQNQGEIDAYGLRSSSKQLHLFVVPNAAQVSANLQLRRELVQNTFRFDLDQRYILLDPMDIISISDATLGISNLLVRITEIGENDDNTLSFTCEEVAQGTGSTPLYTFAVDSGQPFVNTEAPPGNMNAPTFFEPPWPLNGDLEVWAAVSGDQYWGGADVWTSTDGVNYTFAQTIFGSCRMGTLTALLPTYTAAVVGQTIDQTNTLAVDLTESNGSLTSASMVEATKLSTLCYVDGELIAFAFAALTATNKYNLTYLVRGCYDSPIGAHASGSKFARLDLGVLKIPFTQDRIGQTIYIKFASFNQFGGGKLPLSSVGAISYTIQGTALKDPLPDVTNIGAVYGGTLAEIGWTEVTDFRPVLYEIREGASWLGGQFRALQAHPPFRVQGAGTYWIAAYSQPIAGLIVYSANPQSIAIVNPNVTANIVATKQEDPTWPGTLSGNAQLVGGTIQVIGLGSGTYTIPTGDRISITYPFACAVIMNWTSSASPLQNSLFDYRGTAGLIAGSTVISNLQIFSGNGQLQGNTTIIGLNTTAGMGSGQPITGTGISPGVTIVQVLSTTSLTISSPATTGSTVSPSTQAISVFPFLSPGLYIEATSTTIIPAGTKIASTSSTAYSVCYVATSATPLATSTVDIVAITVDFINDADLYGANSAAEAIVFPQLRMSTDGGISFSSWQNWQAGYYVGNVFDARMQIQCQDVDSVAILEAFGFSVDAPNRVDHYTALAVSSLGSTLIFRPDGASTTAAFNGGQHSATSPTITASIASGNPARTVVAGAITLAQCLITCYSSTGGPINDTVNVVAQGF